MITCPKININLKIGFKFTVEAILLLLTKSNIA